MNQELVQVRPESNELKLGALLASDPAQVVQIASKVATELVRIVEEKKLFTQIGKKKFPHVEAWTTCAAMLGISPKEKNVKVTPDGDYEADVELIDALGNVVGGASAICGADEETWKNRPRYARRSMAITRATGKACRLKFSWIMTLAGYEPTPSEEIEGTEFEKEIRDAKPVRSATDNDSQKASSGGDWRNVEIHFGKNKGKKLGELDDKQLRWYRFEWQPEPYNGKISTNDQRLRTALDQSVEEGAKAKMADSQPQEEDNIPFN